MQINEEHRAQMLKAALEGRIREVTEYQVNIDNFRLAIKECGPEDTEFRDQLIDLLESNLREQRKAVIMLNVIRKQVEAM